MRRPWGHASILTLALLFFAAAVAAPSASAGHVDRGEIGWACGFGSRTPGACGIQPITRPRFTEDSWIAPDEKVMGVALGGDARAYPIKMLDRHEIVLDDFGGRLVAVTWCPLCGSAVVYDRIAAVDGKPVVLDLDVSGYLYKHDLVMYDKGTETLWTQIDGSPIATWTGSGISTTHPEVKLTTVSSELTTWAAWRDRHPGSRLLASEGGGYGGAYPGYTGDCSIGISGREDCDIEGLHPKEVVIGVEGANGTTAFPFFGVRRSGGAVVGEFAGEELAVVALADGAARVWDVKGRDLQAAGEGWVDGFGRMWDLEEGRSLDGLHRLVAHDHIVLYWFAWREHHPATELWLPDSLEGQLAPEPRGIPGPGALVAALALMAAAVAIAKRRSRMGG